MGLGPRDRFHKKYYPTLNDDIYRLDKEDQQKYYFRLYDDEINFIKYVLCYSLRDPCKFTGTCSRHP